MTKAQKVLDVYRRHNKAYDVIVQPSQFLQDAEGRSISPKTYWNNCRRRFNAIVDLPSFQNTQAWMSRYNKALSRNKTMGVVAHIVSQYIGTSVLAQNKQQMEDVNYGLLAKDIVEWSYDAEHFERTRFWGLLTGAVEGRVIWEECWSDDKRVVKDLLGVKDDGTYEYEQKEITTYRGASTAIVPNDQFLVPNPFTRDVNEQDYVIRVKRMTKPQFLKQYGKMKGAKSVRPGKFDIDDTDDFKKFDSFEHTQENEIVVLHHYDLSEDEHDIVANGKLLTDIGNPIPRPANKKKYPFVLQVFEPVDNDYFLGKGIIDRTGREEDSINLLYRLYNDREFLNTFPPLETDNESLLNSDDPVSPGLVVARTPGSDGTTPIIQNSPTVALANMIDRLERNADDASISSLQQGQAPSGGTPTATQTLEMAKNAQTILNTFNELQRHAIAELGELRLETLLWQLKTDETKKITVHDRILKNGKRGSRVFMLGDTQSLLPEEKAGLSSVLKDTQDEAKGKLEAYILDRKELLEEMEYHVRVDAEPKPRRTDDLMKLLAMDKFNFYKMNADVFNPLVAAEDVAVAFGDDPDEVVNDQPTQQPQSKIMQPQDMPSVDIKQAMGLPQ